MTKKRKTVKKKIDNKKIEELEKEISNSKEQYIRLLAEWENYRKRTTKEKSMSIEYGKEVVISKILPILDDFERAKKILNQIILMKATYLFTKNYLTP